MTTAIPQIPPRPARTAQQSSATDSGSTLGADVPKIPPRPANRRIERSMSPSRESFARSPLNETSFIANHGLQSKPSLYSTESANNSGTDLVRRPSSVALPSIGQEGNEYAEVFAAQEDLDTSPAQTRNVANDLKLHAPKPSLPQSSAKARVSAVTRTDSGQAAAYGIGKASSSNDDKDPSLRNLKTKASFASQASNSTERRPSSADSEHGIPEIGQRVPMYPNAGDVQAPSPSPFAQLYAPGVGFHNDGSKPRHHGRRTSARGINDLPLEAYGKHGHGVVPSDRFEKAYYEKHPELIKKEIEPYHERPVWAMSSDDLNKIVRDTASRGSGLGTSGIIGTPSEQIGFQAAEEYASRMSSPRPQSASNPLLPNASDINVESPLRKQSFPIDVTEKSEFERTLSSSLRAPSDVALSESELEDEDVIHVDAPETRFDKIYGAAGRYDSTENLGQEAFTDDDYTAPILAADEVAKEPIGWDLQPAVSPMQERRDSEGGYHIRTGSASSQAGSRPTSRPGSIHGNIPGLRMSESTPLEDLEEYEPLFPEDENTVSTAKKPLTAVDRLKRPTNRKFPSQDIWEDTPDSLKYTATVSTPQLPESNEEAQMPEETPEQAFARKQEELAEQEFADSESFLNREKKPLAYKSYLLDEETRPGLKQRFPSRDVWEDTPDSLQLQTVVNGPQTSEKDVFSPPEERPTTGAVAYHQEKKAAGFPLGSEEGRATTGIAATLKPQIPARPARSKPAESIEKQQPSIPERPSRLRQAQIDAPSPPVPTKSKPLVPARPSKPVTRESSENVPLTQVKSNSSAKSVGSDQGSSSATASKPKPPVPSRPGGSKIAALQGGFMSDLNKRLQLGPQAPKKEEVSPDEPEVEKEKVPLVDARKSRARGPARRAPAKSPASLVETTHKPSPLSFCVTATCWEIDPEEDLLQVLSGKEDAPTFDSRSAELEIPNFEKDAAKETVHETSEIAIEAEKSAPVPSGSEGVLAEDLEEVHQESAATSVQENELEPVKQSNVGPVSSEESAGAEDMLGSTGTVKALNDVLE